MMKLVLMSSSSSPPQKSCIIFKLAITVLTYVTFVKSSRAKAGFSWRSLEVKTKKSWFRLMCTNWMPCFS